MYVLHDVGAVQTILKVQGHIGQADVGENQERSSGEGPLMSIAMSHTTPESDRALVGSNNGMESR